MSERRFCLVTVSMLCCSEFNRVTFTADTVLVDGFGHAEVQLLCVGAGREVLEGWMMNVFVTRCAAGDDATFRNL